jgi:hypothetical protein
MYEVEIQLGDTDESHIIRTIEYWDKTRRLKPFHSHTAVLIAERITSRFYNIVHLLSQTVPIIGIQANILLVGDQRVLHFTKIIDSYIEPELEEEANAFNYDEKYWVDNYPGTLECAKWFKDLLSKYYGEIPVKYFEWYMSFSIGNMARMWVNRRKNERAWIEIRYWDEDINEVVERLEKEGLNSTTRGEYVRFNTDIKQLKKLHETLEWLVQKLGPDSIIKKEE